MEKMPYMNRASALLIALIAMSILMLLSLGVSKLLLQALQDSRGLLETTQAWFAAETGIEYALFEISEQPPGYETRREQSLISSSVPLNPADAVRVHDARYSYGISAVSRQFPPSSPERKKYRILKLNESVTIPLFRGGDSDDQVKSFAVEYYFAPDLALKGFVQDDLDILRWKIFGIAADNSMEVINEFVPMSGGKSPETPSCIGTRDDCWNYAKYYQKRTDAGGAYFEIVPEHPIKEFLRAHTQNFLVLTNLTNVDLIAPGSPISLADRKRISNIYYRVSVPETEPQFTLPEIVVESDGFSGNAKQSLDLSVERKSFLPVFDYALYRTAE